jgi:cell division transport system permease protein
MTTFERALRATRADLKLHVLSVFSVAVAFVCLAAALLVVVNIQALRARWESSGRASVYLRPDVTVEQTEQVKKALAGSAGVEAVRFVSAEEARADVVGASSDEALASLPPEAFPASLEVTLRDEAATERLKKLSVQLEALPYVDGVETYAAWGQRLGRLLSGGVSAALLLFAVVLGAVISVVSSTMRMALSRRSSEVEVLKMVGATDSYVRGPFVVEGAFQGAMGAVAAVALLGCLFLIVRGSFDGALGTLLGSAPAFLPWTACVVLVVLGASIGALTAFASLRKLLVSGT